MLPLRRVTIMIYINYFEIMRDIIESNIDFTVKKKGITREEVCTKIKNCCREISKAYYSNQNPNIPYKDPLYRLAYLYSAVPVNANLVDFVFENDPELEVYLDKVQSINGQVYICTFGGGPGTEILGLAKRIEKRNLNHQIVLKYLLLDQVNEWQESLITIEKQIELKFQHNIGINISSWPLMFRGQHSSKIDITDTGNFGNLGNLFGQDLTILSYIISEVFDDATKLRGFLTEMVTYAPSGSKFLFIERNEGRWKCEIERIAKDARLILSDFHDTKNNMSGDEQKTQLGQLFSDIEWSPRLTWNAFWVVGTKE